MLPFEVLKHSIFNYKKLLLYLQYCQCLVVYLETARLWPMYSLQSCPGWSWQWCFPLLLDLRWRWLLTFSYISLNKLLGSVHQVPWASAPQNPILPMLLIWFKSLTSMKAGPPLFTNAPWFPIRCYGAYGLIISGSTSETAIFTCTSLLQLAWTPSCSLCICINQRAKRLRAPHRLLPLDTLTWADAELTTLDSNQRFTFLPCSSLKIIIHSSLLPSCLDCYLLVFGPFLNLNCFLCSPFSSSLFSLSFHHKWPRSYYAQFHTRENRNSFPTTGAPIHW